MTTDERIARIRQRLDNKGFDTADCDDIESILRSELADLIADGERIDALEDEMKREPLLLHNLHDSEEFPRHPRGLGLIPWRPRTLREALDSIRDSRKWLGVDAARQQPAVRITTDGVEINGKRMEP